MDDLISRAAAIEALSTPCDKRYRHGVWETCLDNIETAIRNIPAVDAVPVVQRWISVKDRLPEVAGWYIVFYNENAMQVAYFKGKKWPFNNHYHTITHWMPLPEPPKMDGDS